MFIPENRKKLFQPDRKLLTNQITATKSILNLFLI